MMASPDYMKSEYEKMPYEELLKERDELLRFIKQFESDELDESEFFIEPGPDVQYQMSLEYLSVLALVIAEKYRMQMDEDR